MLVRGAEPTRAQAAKGPAAAGAGRYRVGSWDLPDPGADDRAVLLGQAEAASVVHTEGELQGGAVGASAGNQIAIAPSAGATSFPALINSSEPRIARAKNEAATRKATL